MGVCGGHIGAVVCGGSSQGHTKGLDGGEIPEGAEFVEEVASIGKLEVEDNVLLSVLVVLGPCVSIGKAGDSVDDEACPGSTHGCGQHLFISSEGSSLSLAQRGEQEVELISMSRAIASTLDVVGDNLEGVHVNGDIFGGLLEQHLGVALERTVRSNGNQGRSGSGVVGQVVDIKEGGEALAVKVANISTSDVGSVLSNVEVGNSTAERIRRLILVGSSQDGDFDEFTTGDHINWLLFDFIGVGSGVVHQNEGRSGNDLSWGLGIEASSSIRTSTVEVGGNEVSEVGSLSLGVGVAETRLRDDLAEQSLRTGRSKVKAERDGSSRLR